MAAASAVSALEPASSASFATFRTSTNSGSDVQASGGGSYRVVPHVIGGPVAGRSSSASFNLNEGRVGSAVTPNDDIYVDPLWVAQGDVDGDPTVGLAGCAPPLFPLTFGLNAFGDVASAVGAANTFGRVHLLNGTHPAENVAVARRITILGVDESVAGCAGTPGRTGAVVVPSTAYAPGKTFFTIQSPDVAVRDLALDGDNTVLPDPSEGGTGILVSDGTGTINGLTIQNVGFSNLRDYGVNIEAPGTTPTLVLASDFTTIGDFAGGSASGAAVRFAGASGIVQGGSIQSVPVGVEADGVTVAAPGFSVRVEGVQFNGAMDIAVAASDVYAPGASTVPATVEVLNNSVAAPVEAAAIAVRRVGRDGAGPRNLGVVRVSGNTVSDLAGTTGDPTGVFVQAVDPAFGSVEISGNTLDALASTLSLAGVHVDTRDVLGVPGAEVPAANVAVDGNTITEWATGVTALNSGTGGAASVAVALGATAPNTIEGTVVGVDAGPDSTVNAGNALLAAQPIRNNTTGVRVQGAGSRANLVNNELTGNAAAAVLAGADASVMMEGNLVRTGPAINSVGVDVAAAGTTVDLGGGAFASAGGNTLDADAADAWALSVQAASTLSAEGNTWQYQGTTYNASTAVDDLIRDGDGDNVAAGGEAGTFGPVDFIPFTAGTLASSVILEPFQSRGGTPGYGTTHVRTLADAVEASAIARAVTAEAGSYPAVRHDASGALARQGIDFLQPLTITAATPGLAMVLPAADGPGTTADTVQEAGSVTLLRVLSDDVVLDGLVLDGDNPSIAGTTTVNGVDVEARNAIVIDGSTGGGGPDSLAFTGLTVRNFFHSGIVVEDVAGNKLDDMIVTGNTFTNIDGIQTPTAQSTALRVAEARRANLSGNTFDEVQAAIDFRANDTTSVHTVAGNTVTNAGVLGIGAGSVAGSSLIRLTGNSVSGGALGVRVSDVATSGMVEARANIITAAGEGMRVRAVDGASLVAVVGNTFTASGGTTGLATHQTASSGAGFGVVLDTNAFDGYTTGVLVAADLDGLGAQDNTGTSIARNTFTNNGAGVQVEGASGATVLAMVGGADPSFRNAFSTNTLGVSVAGPGATAEVRNNFVPNVFPLTGAAFDGHDIAISIENGAKAIVAGNEILNSSVAAIRVTGTGTEALVETNDAVGTSNQVGILVADNALASMGPGTAPTIGDPFFGGAVSTGLNKLRLYTGTGGNFAIENTSAADQNAENNDFNTLDLVAIEGFVQHQPDNGEGLVLFDPPSNQFTGIEDWNLLQQE